LFSRPWEPEKLVPPELREAIRDKKLPSEKKSKIVYQCSLNMMGRLFEDQKTENIREAKAALPRLWISSFQTTRLLRHFSNYFARFLYLYPFGKREGPWRAALQISF
jgi:hypothetical protein